MQYPGGKNGGGSFQQIISEIPLHARYIEVFAGSAAVFRMKVRVERSILVDADLRSCAVLRGYVSADVAVVCMDALDFLVGFPFRVDDFLYLDPPYLFETRRSGTAGMYRREFGTVRDHARLLDVLRGLPCPVALSGYASDRYNAMLPGWRRKSWDVWTRGGPAVEVLWMNYPTPALLSDGRYVGADFTERQRLRRLAGVEGR